MSEAIGVGIHLQNYGIYIEDKTKDAHGVIQQKVHYIVHPITTSVPASSLFAILGGSGSGKTTLLNAVAGRYDKKSYNIEGSLLFEKENCSVGYVSQADYLLPNLTVKETLLFTARLKIANSQISKIVRRSYSHDPKHEDIAEEVILDLGLKECQNSRIGDDVEAGGKRGISGGEKRRVSVALQILTNPEVLCADEPTSGLDSFTAITLMESLQRLTKGSRRTTVISAIHQPRADVFAIFDNVLILSKGGYAIYCGPTKHMIDYFHQLGYDCPNDANPADFYVDLSSVDVEDGEGKRESTVRVKKLVTHFQEQNSKPSSSVKSVEEGTKEPGSEDGMEPRLSVMVSENAKPYVLPWMSQMWLLLKRFALNNYRDYSNFVGGILQALILGIIIMGIFWQLDFSTEGIESRSGLTYVTLSMEHYILMIILVERYCRELKIFDRELLDNLYDPSAYFVAHLISMSPQLILQSVVYSLPIYFGCNLRPGAGNFFIFLAVMITSSYVINGLSWMCLSMQRVYPEASLTANINFTFISLTAGFLVNFDSLPIYVFWVRYISFLSYGYRIIMTTEFTDRLMGDGCDSDDYLSAYNCVDGNQVLADNGVVQNDYKNTWPVIFSIAIAYHVIAVIALNVLRFPPIGAVVTEILAAKSEQNDLMNNEIGSQENNPCHDDANVINNKVEFQNSSTNSVEITITVNKVNLFVRSPDHSIFGSATTTKTINPELSATTVVASAASTSNKKNGLKRILHNVNLEIQPGKLVAIMGGSGSGKTTLLNLIANRIPHSCLHSRLHDEENDAGTSFDWLAPSHSLYSGTGFIHFNKRKPTASEIRSAIGYVQQFDYHLPSLTVSETLTFHAHLRLPLSSTSSEKEHRVMEVIQTLGLQQCGHIRVGSEDVKGISGGEKRRLSIGVQLLSDPSVCLFDEPTTGLDAFTARHIVLTLKQLTGAAAKDGGNGSGKNNTKSTKNTKKTIILSIHQPRYDIFACIDEVILVSRGEILWSGAVYHMLQHFQSIGFPCPAFTNPADFILDISSIDFRSPEKERTTRETLATLVLSFSSRNEFPTFEMIEQQQQQQGIPNKNLTDGMIEEQQQPTTPSITAAEHPIQGMDDKDTAEEEHASWSFDSIVKPDYFTFPLLLKRSWMNLSRQTDLLISRVTQAIFYGLILSCFYAPVGDDQTSIQNRIGNLYELTALTFIGMLNAIAIFPNERNVFYREYVDGYYTVRSFILTYYAIAIPILIVAGMGIAVLMVYAVGLKPHDSMAWLEFAFILFCFMMVGECLGIIFCSVFHHVGFSLNIVSAVISIFCIMAGFLSLSMPDFIKGISNLSPMYWGAYILANITFEDETFTCSSSQLVNGTCPLSTGDDVLTLYGFNHGNVTAHYWILALVTGGYWLLSIIALRLRAWKLSH